MGVAIIALKGYPEYKPDQPRDQHGRWTGGGAWDNADHLKTRFPGHVTDIKSGVNYKYVTVTKGLDTSLALTVNSVTKRAHLGLLEAEDTREGRNIARDYMHYVYDALMQSDSQWLDLSAGLESGGYVWPRLGFYLRDQDAQRQLLSQVMARIADIQDAGGLPTDLGDEVASVISGYRDKLSLGLKLAELNQPVDQALFDSVVGVTGSRAVSGSVKPTLGKLLLLGTSARYTLPRNSFGVFVDWYSTSKRRMDKGNPEFNPDEPRDSRGRWTDRLEDSGGPSKDPHTPRGRLLLSRRDIFRLTLALLSLNEDEFTGAGSTARKILRNLMEGKPWYDQLIIPAKELEERREEVRREDIQRIFDGMKAKGYIFEVTEYNDDGTPKYYRVRPPAPGTGVIDYDEPYGPPAKKGYPEFDPSEPRDEGGRWTGGEGNMRFGQHDRAKLVALIKSRLPGARVAFLRSTGRKKEAELQVSSNDIVFSAILRPDGKMWVGDMRAGDNPQGQRAAVAAMSLLRKIAIDSGASAIVIEAGEESGGYAWPLLGFDLADNTAFEKVRDIVTARLDDAEAGGYLNSAQVLQARLILRDGGVDMATKIARLNDPVSEEAMVYTVGRSARALRNPTIGKMLLMRSGGSKGVDYVLTRDKFGSLGPVAKGYPEFKPDQPRDSRGKWTSGSITQTATFSQEDLVSVRAYTGWNGPLITRSLREGRTLDPSESKIVDVMDRYIAGHTAAKDLTVWRGLAGDWVRNTLLNLEPGGVFEDKGFTSTSSSQDVASHYATDPVFVEEYGDRPSALIQVDVPKGSHVGPVVDTDEVLLPRGSRFEYIGEAPNRNDLPVFRFKLISAASKSDVRSLRAGSASATFRRRISKKPADANARQTLLELIGTLEDLRKNPRSKVDLSVLLDRLKLKGLEVGGPTGFRLHRAVMDLTQSISLLTDSITKGYPEFDPDQPRGGDGRWVPHGIPASEWTHAELRHDYIEGTVQRDRIAARGKVAQDVPTNLFRSARDQSVVDARGTQSKDDPVRAIRTPDGLFHIANGHHRVFEAMQAGQNVKEVHYYDRVSKGYPEYRPDQARDARGRWSAGGGPPTATVNTLTSHLMSTMSGDQDPQTSSSMIKDAAGAVLGAVKSGIKAWWGSLSEEEQDAFLINVIGATILGAVVLYLYLGLPIPEATDPDIFTRSVDVGAKVIRWLWRNMP